jgi:asparagine synthase (glutamine-hydrolysing)
MCGLFGVLTSGEMPPESWFAELGGTLKHRGPDHLGVFTDYANGIGISHNRLAILDLSPLGNQPMHSRNRRYTIVFNGEIYNHLELRLKLKKTKSNIEFRSTSDTETILELFEHWGVEPTLQSINGMFAIALWDHQHKILMLARDRVGEKPIYIGKFHNTFVFASELKPILKGFPAEINQEAVPLMLSLGYVPQPLSILKNVFKLEPGTFITLSKNECNNTWNVPSLLSLSKHYWSIEDHMTHLPIQNIDAKNDVHLISELERKLEKSVKQKMIADVKVGACLSGGIDSSLVVALMQKSSSQPVDTFTVGFENQAYDESIHAKKIAQHLGCNHTEIVLSAKEAIKIIPTLAKTYDEPFGDSSQIPTMLVSKALKEHVTVALSGDGGDELFFGYERYIAAPKLWSVYKHLQPVTTQLAKYVNNNISHKHYKLWRLIQRAKAPDFDSFYCAFMATNPCTSLLFDDVKPLWNACKIPNKISQLSTEQRMSLADIKSYLPDDILVKVDRASMHYSLEMRAPFLDHDLIGWSAKLPSNVKYRDGKSKWICRQLLAKYVPETLFDRPKQGFGVPIQDWLTTDLNDWAEYLLRKESLARLPGIKLNVVANLWHAQKAGKIGSAPMLWNLLMLLAWCEEWNL